ncbi:hypothetical protein [Spirosoma validum]|uniref:Uncharacterized protein n=1 Tax=Spirosoma validum TaxID=2771355 RepID=A0A927B1B9_9BACT|nr:hypothetical protein [Spirosoma validum]MBD2753755.1 hypothetical protein [Spirosoma validum]
MDKKFSDKALVERQAVLEKAVKDLVVESDLSDNLEEISSAFYSHFLFMVDADPERDVDHTKVFELREHHISSLFSTLRLMVRLAAIYEAYDRVDNMRKLQEVGCE